MNDKEIQQINVWCWVFEKGADDFLTRKKKTNTLSDWEQIVTPSTTSCQIDGMSLNRYLKINSYKLWKSVSVELGTELAPFFADSFGVKCNVKHGTWQPAAPLVLSQVGGGSSCSEGFFILALRFSTKWSQSWTHKQADRRFKRKIIGRKKGRKIWAGLLGIHSNWVQFGYYQFTGLYILNTHPLGKICLSQNQTLFILGQYSAFRWGGAYNEGDVVEWCIEGGIGADFQILEHIFVRLMTGWRFRKPKKILFQNCRLRGTKNYTCAKKLSVWPFILEVSRYSNADNKSFIVAIYKFLYESLQSAYLQTRLTLHRRNIELFCHCFPPPFVSDHFFPLLFDATLGDGYGGRCSHNCFHVVQGVQKG